MGFKSCAMFFCVLYILCCYLLDIGTTALDTITSSQFIKDPETLSSKDGNFTLGFFSPENSTNRYVGIWWKSPSTVIWVANRNQPLDDSSGVVTISEDGNLVVLDGHKRLIWSSNVSNTTSNTSSQFSGFGNLVLSESTKGNILWQSFTHASHTILPGMKLTRNKTSEKLGLISWKSPSDPSLGSFSSRIVERPYMPEVFIWNETRSYWRSGPWNGRVFTGIQGMEYAYLEGFYGGDDGEGNIDIYFKIRNEVKTVIYSLNWQGQFQAICWDDEKKEMQILWTSKKSECDVYGTCGAFTICSSLKSSPICNCLRGFEPKNKEEWSRQNWTSGCVRRTNLQCEGVNNTKTSADGFLKLEMVKVPDFAEGSHSPVTPDICRIQCLENCSCAAYSHDAGIGCISWTGILLDIQQFSEGGLDLYVRVAYTEFDHGTNTPIIISVTVIIGTVIIVVFAYIMWRRRTSKHPGKLWDSIRSRREKNNKGFPLFNQDGTSEDCTNDNIIGELSQVNPKELLLFDFEKIATATNNFHMSNKLGQGGFGPVYKGKLQDGQEIAVKRLSRASGQGLEEFKNEAVVICKLQHCNLVRLIGCCIVGGEKMLIYEYMSNGSLDANIFDPSKSEVLDWRTRCSIIEGIARGLLYLHRDSRLRIIHRDLKPSNILLDEELNPKISDFGMARIFGRSEDQANTRRIVGTYGYMSPEYAMQGLFSVKSDVFSFGVLILEIVSGKRNSSFYDDVHALSLLGFAWIQWRDGNISSLIDPRIYDPSHDKSIIRCIHIGLLCVQEHAVDRPTMATVISMLNSNVEFLPPPSHPAFILRQNMLSSVSSEENHKDSSINTISLTDIYAR